MSVLCISLVEKEKYCISMFISLKQILELTNHLGIQFHWMHPETILPRQCCSNPVFFHLNMLFSMSLLLRLLMWSHLLAPQCTTLQHEKAVSSRSLGWPECNANIRTHLWPHNKHSHHYVAPDVFPEGKLCWRCKCSWILSYVSAKYHRWSLDANYAVRRNNI